MSNRILSVIIIAGLILCLASPVSIVADKASGTDSLRLMAGLGIGGLENDTVPVTRSEFAAVVSDIINRNVSLSVGNSIFTDVKPDSEYAAQIHDLVARGIISGYSDSTFRPNDIIYYEQAIKMLLSAMGYDILCQGSGGYPYGYLKIASEKKLLLGLSKNVGDSVLPHEVALLVSNALEAQILIQNGFGDQSDYETREGDTLVSEYMKLDKISGVITDNGITALTGASRVSTGQILINGVTYNSGESKAADLLGYSVDIYVERTNKEIIYAAASHDNNVVHIDTKSLCTDSDDFSLQKIVYENIYGKTTSESVDTRADFIYNSVVFTDLTVNDLKIPAGRLELVDNDGDGKADVVFIYNAETIVISSVNKSEDKIYSVDKTPYELDNSKNVTIKKDGKPASIEDLLAGDVATIYRSRDRMSIDVYASSAKLLGKVESKSISDGYTVLVSGEYYRVTDSSVYANLQLGYEYEFCLDCENNIVAVKSGVSTSQNVGYYVDSKISGGIDKKLVVRIFTVDGQHTYYNCNSKISIDGDTERTLEDALAYLKANAQGKLVEYGLNSGGEINNIVLPKVSVSEFEDFYGLRMNYDTAGTLAYYSANLRSFAGKVTLGEDAVIFRIPTDSLAYDDYCIEKRSYFLNKNGYDFKAYSIGEEDGRSDFLLLVADSTVKYSADNTPVTVSKITSVLDEDGEARDCMIAYGYRGEVRYLSETRGIFAQNNINPGDVVRCALNLKGQVSAVKKIYDGHDKMIVDSEAAATTYWDSCRSLGGEVWCRYDTLIGITTADTTSSNYDIVKSSLEYHNFENAKIYVVDTKGREIVSEGNVEDAFDYVSVGSERSCVYMYSYDSEPRMLVVYK